MTKRIATSPLTGRIHQGRVNAEGTAFVGEKQDVTSDVLKAVIDKAEFHGGSFEIASGDFQHVWDVTVSKRSATHPTKDTKQ